MRILKIDKKWLFVVWIDTLWIAVNLIVIILIYQLFSNRSVLFYCICTSIICTLTSIIRNRIVSGKQLEIKHHLLKFIISNGVGIIIGIIFYHLLERIL